MLIALAVLGLLSALVMVPVDTGPLTSDAQPFTTFESAAAGMDVLRAREAPLVFPDGASLAYLHGQRTPRVIVLVHGLTNSPRQFRELAELFRDRGYNVIVPRLPLHGLRAGKVEVLKDLTATELRDYADRAADIAHGLGDTVIVMGLSTGGNVAAWMAHHRPDVARIVIIAPAIKLARLPSALAAPAMNLADRLPNMTIHQQPDTLRRHAYFGVSTRALAETFRFAATVVGEAESGAPVVKDLTIVTNGNDHTVDAGAVQALANSWEQRGGAAITRYHFDAAMGLPHDVIDVSQRCGAPGSVYPVLVALVEKTPLPSTMPIGPCGHGADATSSAPAP